MSSDLKKKVESLHVGEKLKETGSALVSDVKEIAKDTKNAASGTIDQAKEKTKEGLEKVEKKLG